MFIQDVINVMSYLWSYKKVDAVRMSSAKTDGDIVVVLQVSFRNTNYVP